MISIQFSNQDLADIDEACDNPDLPDKIKRKLMCLKMHQQKVTNIAITRILNISANTVTSYIREFRDHGIAGIMGSPRWSKATLPPVWSRVRSAHWKRAERMQAGR